MRKIDAMESHKSTYISLTLTFKGKVKEAEKTEATLKGQLDKMSVELEKMKCLKEEAEVSDVCFSSYDITVTSTV